MSYIPDIWPTVFIFQFMLDIIQKNSYVLSIFSKAKPIFHE